MFSAKGKGAHERTAMVFDVGSGSIGAAVVVLSRASLPNIVWSKRIPITFQPIPDYDGLAKTMLSTLLDLALEMQAAAEPILKRTALSKSVNDVMFAFASPWYSMQAKTFKIEKESPFAITQDFLQKLIRTEEEAFYKRIAQKTKVANDSSPVLIEREIIQTSLNGYIVSDPYNKAVRKSQIDVVLSAVPSYLHDKAQEISRQLIKGKGETHVHSFILPSFIVAREIFHNKHSFLLLDISAEVTDVVAVHKGTILDATSFPIGKHYVIREVAKKLNTTPEEAAATLSTFMSGDTSVGQLEKINKILEEVQKTWVEAFCNTLTQISCDAPISKDLYVTVDQDYTEWFTRVIASGDYSEYALSKNPFRIRTINPEVLEGRCEHNQLTAMLDPFLAIEAIFMHKIFYE